MKRGINIKNISKDIYMKNIKLILSDKTNFLSLNNNKIPTQEFADKNPQIHNILAKNSPNYGIRCEHVVCVDCDLDKEGKDIKDKYKNTFTQKTGGGGFHYIYKIDDRMAHWKSRSNLGPNKYDIKIGKNSYFVGAGSTSKKGLYSIYNDVKPIKMPDGLFNEINDFYIQKTEKNTNKKNIIFNNTEIPSIKKSMIEIKHIIDKCPNSYFENYDSWRDIGWAMHYENNSDECKKLFIKRSREVKDYTYVPDDTYDHFWNNSNKNNSKQISFGTIINWLKRDKLYNKNIIYNDTEFNIKNFYSIKLPKKPEDAFINKMAFKEQKIKKEQDIVELFNLRKIYFNKYHFKVAQPVCYCIINDDGIDIKKKNDFKDLYDNLLVNDKSFISLWFKDLQILTYKKLDFAPPGSNIDNNCFNLYQGLYIENILDSSDESIDIFTNHINLLCGKELKSKNYCINYLAHMLQFPGIKPRTSMVFISDQGVGKNVFFENFANKILGNKYLLQTADQENVFGRFNMANQKLMILVDEASGKDSFFNSEKIKNKICCETILFEKKGVDKIVLKDFARYLFFSNNDTPVKISLSDRRFTVFKCSNDKRNNTKYFKALIKSFNNTNLVRSFYNYLMDIDLSDFDPVNDRPKTEIYQELQKVNIPVVGRYLVNTLYHKNKNKQITGKDLYLHFDNFYQSNGFNLKHRPSNAKFGRELKKYEGITKNRSSKGIIYNININQLKTCLEKKGYIETLEFINID